MLLGGRAGGCRVNSAVTAHSGDSSDAAAVLEKNADKDTLISRPVWGGSTCLSSTALGCCRHVPLVECENNDICINDNTLDIAMTSSQSTDVADLSCSLVHLSVFWLSAVSGSVS